MSGLKISGKNVDLQLEPSGLAVEFDEVSLKINDGRKVIMKNGRPAGYVDGEYSADGEITCDLDSFDTINEAVKKSKKQSWQSFPVQDLQFFARIGCREKNVIAYGCLLKLSDVLSLKASGGEEAKVKIPFEVTGDDFVTIDGVNYLDEIEE